MVARTGSGWSELANAYQQSLENDLLEPYRKRRWARFREFSGWLDQENLTRLNIEQAAILFRASGGSRPAEFKANAVEEIRDTLDFLLYDEVKLEGRFDECAMDGGGFKLAGAGKEFISYLLCLHEPFLFGVWNTNSERVLRRVGSRTAITQTGPLGIQYLDVLDGLAQLRNHIGLQDFRAVDEACYCGVRIKADR